jgi:membrane-associated protein
VTPGDPTRTVVGVHQAISDILTAPASLDVVALGPAWLDATNIIRAFVSWLGPLAIIGVCLVVFAESGLMVGFFLPGDSLLFTLGMFLGTGDISTPVALALPVVMLSAIAGDQTGYFIGRKLGPRVFDRQDSRLFKSEYVDRTNAFFDKYGGPTITLAQYVPIVRAFAPVAAGVGRMPYGHFALYNIIGASTWGVGIPLLGMWLGGYAVVRDNIEIMLVLIVLLSVTPMVVEALRAWARTRRSK